MIGALSEPIGQYHPMLGVSGPFGSKPWQKLKDKIQEPFYTLNSAQLPDGHYQFKVRATDAPANHLRRLHTGIRILHALQ